MADAVTKKTDDVDLSDEDTRAMAPKAGSQALRDVHEMGMACKDMLQHHMGQTENPKVLDHLKAMDDAMTAQCSDTASLHKAEYPDEDPLVDKSGTGGDDLPEDSETEVVVKTGVAAKPVAKPAPAAPSVTRKNLVLEAELRTRARKQAELAKLLASEA